MVESVSKTILDILIKNNAVTKDDRAIVLFGIEQGLRSVMEVIVMLITAALMNLFWQSVIILISFIPVRIYAGGYHAKTPMQCAVKSWMLLTAVLLWMKYIPGNVIIQISLFIVTGIWMIIFCPIQDIHKLLRENEKSKYRFKAFRNYFINICVFCMGYITGFQILSRCIALAMFMVLLMMMAGTIKNKRR